MTQNNTEEETLKFLSVVEVAEYLGITLQAFSPTHLANTQCSHRENSRLG